MKLHGPQSDRNRLWTGGSDSRRGDLSSQRDADQVCTNLNFNSCH